MEFREGIVPITGVAITIEHFHVVIDKMLYTFPEDSYDKDNIELLLEKHQPRKIDLAKVFPGKYDHAKNKAMVVWTKDNSTELLCFQDTVLVSAYASL